MVKVVEAVERPKLKISSSLSTEHWKFSLNAKAVRRSVDKPLVVVSELFSKESGRISCKMVQRRVVGMES